MKQISNTDFFKKKIASIEAEEPAEKKQAPQKQAAPQKAKPAPQKMKKAPVKAKPVMLRLGKDTLDTLKELEELFVKNGMKSAARKISAVCNQASRDKFSVAVVGEFSRGKSTFINKLLDKEFLPVGDLPTTAMMTRISYNVNDSMVLVDEKGSKVKTVPAKLDSWEGLTADNFTDDDPCGTMYAGIDNEWLGTNGIEIIDTPGAGDLEEKRARVIGDALKGCDGAIITVSALCALSMSEKLFIEQRLISRKTPFLMLVITKLDAVPYKERADVVGYVLQKLQTWGMNIPVYIPYDIDLPVEKYDNIIGMDKIKGAIEAWVSNPDRVRLTEEWLLARAAQIVNNEVDALNEQLLLLKADDDKREELINEKKQLLLQSKTAWEDLRIQLLEKGNECYRFFLEKINESVASVIERLQYEASHNNNLQKWWSEDYPYRLKIELSNMSTNVENAVSRKVAEDARWFNTMLEKQFKAHVLFESDKITDKSFYDADKLNTTLELKDLNKKRTLARVGTTVLSIALYPACAAVGVIPIVATMGVSTGSSIITEKIFSKKTEEQRTAVKAAIAENVPGMIQSSVSESEARIKAMYNDIVKSAVEKEQEWIESQYTVIENSVRPKNTQQEEKTKALIASLNELIK